MDGVQGTPLNISGREVCVLGNWKMLDREREREIGVHSGGRRLGHTCILRGGNVSKLGILFVCALCCLFLSM